MMAFEHADQSQWLACSHLYLQTRYQDWKIFVFNQCKIWSSMHTMYTDHWFHHRHTTTNMVYANTNVICFPDDFLRHIQYQICFSCLHYWICLTEWCHTSCLAFSFLSSPVYAHFPMALAKFLHRTHATSDTCFKNLSDPWAYPTVSISKQGVINFEDCESKACDFKMAKVRIRLPQVLITWCDNSCAIYAVAALYDFATGGGAPAGTRRPSGGRINKRTYAKHIRHRNWGPHFKLGWHRPQLPVVPPLHLRVPLNKNK